MVVVQVPGKVALCDLDLRYSPPSLSLLSLPLSLSPFPREIREIGTAKIGFLSFFLLS